MSTDKATAAYSAITTQLESWLIPSTDSNHENKNYHLHTEPNDEMQNMEEHGAEEEIETIVEQQSIALEMYLKKRSISYDVVTQQRVDVEYLEELEDVLSSSCDESDLWRLMKLLRKESTSYLWYDSSKGGLKNDGTNASLASLGVYASGDDIVNILLDRRKSIYEVNVNRRRCILLQWIESCLEKKLHWNAFPPSNRDTMWPCSIESLKKGHGGNMLELDEFKLKETDKRHEEELLSCVWQCLQAGCTQKAKKVCIGAGQAWRASSYDMNVNYDDYFLKKNNCVVAAQALQNNYRTKQTSFESYEVAIYSLLGNDVIGCLPCCDSWQKAVQVYLHCMLQRVQDEAIAQHANRVRSIPSRFPLKTTYPDAEAKLLHQTKCFAALTELNMFQELSTRYKLSEVQLLQSCVATGTKSVLDYIKTVDSSQEEAISSSVMAHFVIYYTTLIPNAVPLHMYTNIILDHIHRVLIPTKTYWPHVALYTSLLPDKEVVDTYSSFILDIQDGQHRNIVLRKAREHFKDGFDLLILQQVVNRIFNYNVPTRSSTFDTADQISNSLPPSILNKIHGVLWFTHYPEHYPYALQYANLFLKACILQDQIYPCQVFLQEYFSSFPSTSNQDFTYKEHEMIRIYILSISEYENFEFCLKRCLDDQCERNYNALLRSAITTEQQLMKVIQYPGGWMSFSSEEEDYNLLQCKCLPHVVNMIHTLCYKVGELSNDEMQKVEWFSKAVNVITFVANEDNGLFDFFGKKELEDVLENAVESYVRVLRCGRN